jgi:hypothetical protein
VVPGAAVVDVVVVLVAQAVTNARNNAAIALVLRISLLVLI